MEHIPPALMRSCADLRRILKNTAHEKPACLKEEPRGRFARAQKKSPRGAAKSAAGGIGIIHRPAKLATSAESLNAAGRFSQGSIVSAARHRFRRVLAPTISAPASSLVHGTQQLSDQFSLLGPVRGVNVVGRLGADLFQRELRQQPTPR